MKKILNALLIAAVFFFVFSQIIAGENSKGNIHPNIKLSFAERFRLVTWDNAISLSDAANGSNSFNRTRTNLMGQWFPNNNIEFAVKLTNEFRYYFAPQNREFDMDEIFFDQLYLKYNNQFGTVTLGRQNIILGEGFVVMDGHPLDGSRSIYFNAARVDWNIGKANRLTLFYSYQPVTDNILPEIRDRKQKLIEQPETGIGAYLNSDIKSVNLNAYYIYKKIDNTDQIPEKSNIHTIGTRIALPLTEQFSFTGEAAYQFGDIEEADRSAFGGYTHLDYKTLWGKSYLPASFTLGGIYLSGDDPETNKMEGWDPLFSRWPKWSESYIYTQIREFNGKVAYWCNFSSIYAKINYNLSDGLNLCFDYHRMFAPEKSAAEEFPGGAGKTRGGLFIGMLKYKINEYLAGHLLWENFNPGNFYFNGADGYNWARIELLFKI